MIMFKLLLFPSPSFKHSLNTAVLISFCYSKALFFPSFIDHLLVVVRRARPTELVDLSIVNHTAQTERGRGHWRVATIVLQLISSSPGTISDHLK